MLQNSELEEIRRILLMSKSLIDWQNWCIDHGYYDFLDYLKEFARSDELLKSSVKY